MNEQAMVVDIGLPRVAELALDVLDKVGVRQKETGFDARRVMGPDGAARESYESEPVAVSIWQDDRGYYYECWSSTDYYARHGECKPISLTEALNLLVPKPSPPIIVSLNDGKLLRVMHDGTIKVGCLTINQTQVREIQDALLKQAQAGKELPF